MTRSRREEIEPMVPELPTTDVRADGGRRVAAESRASTGDEAAAPLVPDLS